MDGETKAWGAQTKAPQGQPCLQAAELPVSTLKAESESDNIARLVSAEEVLRVCVCCMYTCSIGVRT